MFKPPITRHWEQPSVCADSGSRKWRCVMCQKQVILAQQCPAVRVGIFRHSLRRMAIGSNEAGPTWRTLLVHTVGMEIKECVRCGEPWPFRASPGTFASKTADMSVFARLGPTNRP